MERGRRQAEKNIGKSKRKRKVNKGEKNGKNGKRERNMEDGRKGGKAEGDVGEGEKRRRMERGGEMERRAVMSTVTSCGPFILIVPP